MFGTKKLKVLSWSVIFSALAFTSCSDKETKSYTISGNTQGTTYSIIIVDEHETVTKESIDSLLHEFDLSLSTYEPKSIISRLNEADSSLQIEDESGFLKRCYQQSRIVYQNTNGAFDPSVYPLVEGWGFLKNVETPLDSARVGELLQLVSFVPGELHKIEFKANTINIDKTKGFKLDFNAIAQGLSVDVIDDYLKSKGLKNYYIEIGGELVLRGKNREGEKWRIGIDVPTDNQVDRELENVLHLSEKAVATSGNYRKFYVKDGVKYAHTINPKTGWPVQHNLLSATVVADNCADADAYATAFMVLGVEETLKLIEEKSLNVEAYLIFSNEKGDLDHSYTKGFESFLK